MLAIWRIAWPWIPVFIAWGIWIGVALEQHWRRTDDLSDPADRLGTKKPDGRAE